MALLDGLGKVGVWVPGHELVGINALAGQQLLDVQAQVQLLPPGQGRRGDLMMAQLVRGALWVSARAHWISGIGQ